MQAGAQRGGKNTFSGGELRRSGKRERKIRSISGGYSKLFIDGNGI